MKVYAIPYPNFNTVKLSCKLNINLLIITESIWLNKGKSETSRRIFFQYTTKKVVNSGDIIWCVCVK